MASSSASPTPPLAKYLASTGSLSRKVGFPPTDPHPTDKKTRDKAVKNLAAFLSDPEGPLISSHEMDKLWKGIFYCEIHLRKRPQIAVFFDGLFQAFGCQTSR